MNRIEIEGRLGMDPELRYTKGETPYCRLSVGDSQRWKDNRTDEWQERTDWHNVTVWGDIAVKAHNSLRKGNLVFVVGRVEYNSWEDDEGKKRYATNVKAHTIRRMEYLKGDDSDDRGGRQSSRRRQPARRNDEPRARRPTPNDGGFDDDEIPF